MVDRNLQGFLLPTVLVILTHGNLGSCAAVGMAIQLCATTAQQRRHFLGLGHGLLGSPHHAASHPGLLAPDWFSAVAWLLACLGSGWSERSPQACRLCLVSLSGSQVQGWGAGACGKWHPQSCKLPPDLQCREPPPYNHVIQEYASMCVRQVCEETTIYHQVTRPHGAVSRGQPSLSVVGAPKRLKRLRLVKCSCCHLLSRVDVHLGSSRIRPTRSCCAQKLQDRKEPLYLCYSPMPASGNAALYMCSRATMEVNSDRGRHVCQPEACRVCDNRQILRLSIM